MLNYSKIFFLKVLIHSELKLTCSSFFRTFLFFFIYLSTSFFLQESYCYPSTNNLILKDEEDLSRRRNIIVSLLNSNIENILDKEEKTATSLDILETILLNFGPMYLSEDFRNYEHLINSDERSLNIHNIHQLLSKNNCFVLFHNLLYSFLELNPSLISNFYSDTPFNYQSDTFTLIEKENIRLVLDCEINDLVSNLKESLLISEGGLIKNINTRNIFLLSRHLVMIKLLKNKVDSLGINIEDFNIE